MKCLVTGGAGFIGSNLVAMLLSEGHEVRVFDDLSTGRRENLDGVLERIELRVQDLRDRQAVAAACEDMDLIFHQGARPSVPRSVEDPRASFEVNAAGTLNLLLGARDAGVKRVVFAASSSAYGDTPTLPKREDNPQNPRSPYAADKVHGENLCRVFTATYGLECVALRYFNVFGPHQSPESAYAAVIPRFIEAVLEGRSPVIYGDGLQSRDFTYVENVVQANLLGARAAGAAGGVFNVGCGDRCSLLKLLDVIQEACGTSLDPIHEAPRLGDVRDSQADISRARKVLGFAPRVGLLEGLRRTVAWFKESRGVKP